jgi:hypothetical protein
MTHLFAVASRFAVVSADCEILGTAPNARHHHFVGWVEAHRKRWRLLEMAPDPVPVRIVRISSHMNVLQSPGRD